MKSTFTTLMGSLAVAALCSTAAHAQTSYQLVWQDDFNNGMSSAWQFENGGGGWGNNEKQYYQPNNTTFSNGNLIITAKKENVGGMPYTSSRLTTYGRKEFTYGKVEARIKMPLGQGLWPAFWMLGGNIGSVGWPKCGEIDIMEQVNADSRVYGTVHWDNNGHAQYGQNMPISANAYHVYSIEWDASAVRWYMDGNKYNEVSILNGAGGTDEFQRPFYLLLNLAVAGNWPGQAVDESKLPATMAVDYVRVYQMQSGAATAYRDCNYSGSAAVALPVGDYTMTALQSRGIGNDDISSMSVNSGYEVQLFQDNNFTGASVTIGSVSCFDGNWNDKVTSLKVRRKVGGRSVASAKASGSEVLAVYPNPVTDQLNVSSDASLAGSSYRVLNGLGQRMASGKLERSNTMNVSHLPAGVYTLIVSTPDQQTLTRRFVK